MTTTEYLASLRALITLGTPLTTTPNGIETTIALQSALRHLNVALLKVEAEITNQLHPELRR